MINKQESAKRDAERGFMSTPKARRYLEDCARRYADDSAYTAPARWAIFTIYLAVTFTAEMIMWKLLINANSGIESQVFSYSLAFGLFIIANCMFAFVYSTRR